MNGYAIDAFGLSPGDRACLALARTGKLAALTADRAWTDAGPMAGVDVDLIPGRGDGATMRG